MWEELTPPDKTTYHGKVRAFFLFVVSFFASATFVNVLTTGALFSHLYQVVVGIEKKEFEAKEANGYKPRKAYPNLEKMKPTKDLRYFALQLDLELEEYNITTEDGYILTLHHFFDPKESVEVRDKKRPILLQHGLLSCSGAFITPGTNSLAYYLHENGYDVWLGNNRSHFEARHTYYTGNLFHNELYWDWDIRCMAYYDMPCIIDNILAHKPNHSKLTIGAHSQGCAQTFLLLRNGNLKEYHQKIDFFIPMAPACFPGKLFMERWFLKFLNHRGPFSFKAIFGLCAFIKLLGTLRNSLATTVLYRYTSYILFKFLFGWNAKRWSASKKVRHFNAIFNATYVSSRLMTWWTAHYVEEGFSNQLLPYKDYLSGKNHQPLAEGEKVLTNEGGDDSKSYFPFSRSWFDDVEITVPVYIFSGNADNLVDGKRLIAHMRHYESKYTEGENLFVTQVDGYDHCEFIWAEDLNGLVGAPMVKMMRKMHGETEDSLDSEKFDAQNAESPRL